MLSEALGKIYHDGEVIIRQGDEGNCMYVVQEGQVEVLQQLNGKEVQLGIRGEGEYLGEMAIFEREVRSATVRVLGEARVLTIDQKNFLRRIAEDPSLAFRLVQTLSARIRDLSVQISELKSNC
jgi:CRP-like cAMP-binding protein